MIEVSIFPISSASRIKGLMFSGLTISDSINTSSQKILSEFSFLLILSL
jgi:hypothetical protein